MLDALLGPNLGGDPEALPTLDSKVFVKQKDLEMGLKVDSNVCY